MKATSSCMASLIHIMREPAMHLSCVHNQQASLASRQRPRDLVAEVDVPGRVDEVQRIQLPVGCCVPHAGLIQLNGDATLPLQIHTIEKLGLCKAFEVILTALCTGSDFMNRGMHIC